MVSRDAISIHQELHCQPLRCHLHILSDFVILRRVDNIYLKIVLVLDFLMEILSHCSPLRLNPSENFIQNPVFCKAMIRPRHPMNKLSWSLILNNLPNHVFLDVFCQCTLQVNSLAETRHLCIMAQDIFKENILFAVLCELWPVSCHGLVVVKQSLVYHDGDQHRTNSFT